MHVEFCVEDASGKILLEAIIPKIINPDTSWRVHSYRGIGHIPKGLGNTTNAQKRMILDNLPKLIRGCADTPYISALIIVVDNDDRNCVQFLGELKNIHTSVAPKSKVIFRIAIEEMEAWLLGDRKAIEEAYTSARASPMDSYIQDSICGTWEILADAIYPGGSTALKALGWPAPGVAKCEWAKNIGPRLDINCNTSPSFNKFVEAVRQF